MNLKLTTLVEKLYRSILAADPTRQDVVIADLHDQIMNVKQCAVLSESRISQLEQELAKSQEKRKAYEEALKGIKEIKLKSWSDAIDQKNIAEQAIKPTEL